MVVALWAVGAWAQAVPTPLGLLVLLKVLTYDTRFGEHGSGDFVVLVPYDAALLSEARELVSAGGALDTQKINERPLVFEAVALEDLDARLKARAAAAVLLPRGLNGPGLSRALEAASTRRAYCLALTEDQVKAGAVLGVGLANGRPQPLVNASAAKASGVEFAPSVLRLARVLTP